MLSRRAFVGSGLAAVALLALGGAGLALRPTVYHAPGVALGALDATEFSVLWAIAERVCPANGAFPAASSLQIAEKVDALLARLHPADVTDVKRLLRLVENAAPGLFFDGRVTTFTAADAATQDTILRGWRNSGITLRRTGYKALTGLISATYYSQPEVWAAVGYPGPPDALRRSR